MFKHNLIYQDRHKMKTKRYTRYWPLYVYTHSLTLFFLKHETSPKTRGQNVRCRFISFPIYSIWLKKLPACEMSCQFDSVIYTRLREARTSHNILYIVAKTVSGKIIKSGTLFITYSLFIVI